MPGTERALAPTTIERADDPRLDDYRALNDQRFRRRFEGDRLFVAEGFVAVDRAIDSGHRLRSVVLAPSRVERFGDRLDWCAGHGVGVFVVAPDVLAEVVGFELHRGVVAVGERRSPTSIADVLSATDGDLVALEGVNDPENVGVIARAARALGAAALVLDPTSTDPYSRRSVRVSMGEILHLPVARAARWPDDLTAVRGAGVEIWALTPDIDADDLWAVSESGEVDGDVRARRRVVVLLGAEGPGLSGAALAAADRRVRIPIRSDVDSLNVGHAAAITLAVLARHRATTTP